MSKKKGLQEFLEVFDEAVGMGWLALDLAQNLSFKYDHAKPEYAKISEEDVHLAYGCGGGGKKYPHDLIGAIHKLADVLGYTRADYIDGADKRQGRGNANVYVAGKGSINCSMEELLNEKLET